MPCAPLHITKMDFKTVHPLNILSTDFITIYIGKLYDTI